MPRESAQHHIDIWLVDDINSLSAARQQQYLSLINADERARYQRFVRERDKLLFLVAKALTRVCLSHYEPSIAPQQWEFDFGPHGKPEISQHLSQPLQFNLSHTHSLIALAVGRSAAPLGIDVENVGRSNSLDDLARQCFTEAEQGYLNAGCESEYRQRFFRLWTLKEAFVKATGAGITAGLQSFEFTADKNQISVSGSNPDTRGNWFFYQRSYNEDYAIALATLLGEGQAAPELYWYKGLPLEGTQCC